MCSFHSLKNIPSEQNQYRSRANYANYEKECNESILDYLMAQDIDELVNIARRYTKNWRNVVVDILDKNLQGREFIVIDLTRAKEDALYL
ncbi:19072_t:CDS:2, partial [Entrophospora sp. SA101]